MVCLRDPLVQKICQLYDKISKLDNLNPSKDVDTLFTQLVATCIPPHHIDVSKLCSQVQLIRTNLIALCGRAEGLLEAHFSAALAAFDRPLHHLHLFPYYDNYLKLGCLEFELLRAHAAATPRRVAFVGSGPLPLTSIVLASHHLHSAEFHNFDLNAAANTSASRLVEPHPELSGRMSFHTKDIMDVPGEVLREYDVVFLAALVGMEIEEKVRVIEHLANAMAPGAILMVRSAHGARAFLYPVVEPRHLGGFEVLAVYHPADDVINSVVVARRCAKAVHPVVVCAKCAEIQPFSPLNLIEELTVEEHL